MILYLDYVGMDWKMSPIFPIQFVANCSAGVWVSWKIGKVKKEKALKSRQTKLQKRLCDNYHAHSSGTFRIQSNI